MHSGMRQASTALLETPEQRAELFNAIQNDIFNSSDQKEEEVIEEKAPPKSISKMIKDGEFTEAMAAIRIRKDRSQGIKSEYKTLAGTQVLFRDATQQDTHPTSDKDYYDWATLGINYAAAAQNLFESHGIQQTHEFKTELKNETSKFYNTMKKQDTTGKREIYLALFIHQTLIPLLSKHIKIAGKEKQLTPSQIIERLAQVRDFGNFDEKPLALVTRMTTNGETFTQVDIPLGGGFSPELKSQYLDLASLFTRPPEHKWDIPWYKNQMPHIQYLIKKYANNILAGQIVPTQLREFLPALRNGGEEYLLDETGEIIQKHYHAGSPGHLLSKGLLERLPFVTTLSDTATTQSLKQLQTLTGAKHVLALTLLSPPMREDQDLVSQTRKAVAANNKIAGDTVFHTANIPLNKWGKKIPLNKSLSGQGWMGWLNPFRKPTGADWLVEQAVNEAKSLNKIDQTSKQISEELNALIKDYKKLSAIRWNPFPDKENRNLELVSVITRMAHVVNKAHQINNPTEKQPFVAVMDTCKSGKDRAGLAREQTLIDSIKGYFIRNQKTCEKDTVEGAVLRSNQVPIQAGVGGGTRGAGAIKSDSIAATPRAWKAWIPILFKRVASYNKKVPKDPRKYRAHKSKIVLAAIVIGAATAATGGIALAGGVVVAGVSFLATSGVGAGIAALSTTTLGIGTGAGGLLVLGGSALTARKLNKERKRVALAHEVESEIKTVSLSTGASPSSTNIQFNRTGNTSPSSKASVRPTTPSLRQRISSSRSPLRTLSTFSEAVPVTSDKQLDEAKKKTTPNVKGP